MHKKCYNRQDVLNSTYFLTLVKVLIPNHSSNNTIHLIDDRWDIEIPGGFN